MFKKPHTSKTSAPLRSSDLRKLRIEISTLFSLSSSSIIKQLLPDGLLTFKAISHLDEPLIIYSNSITNDPLFFKFSNLNHLIPTIYTLDLLFKFNLLPILITAQEVVEHLITGSALFSAGVSERSLLALPDGMKEGDLVGISAQGSDKIVAVGFLASSKKELLKDRKGKAVITLHARGDYLYKSGSETIPTPIDQETTKNDKSVDTLGDDLATSTLEEPIASTSNILPEAVAGSSDLSEVAETSENAIELTTSEIDLILLRSLLLAIRHIASLPPATLSKLFPFPASTLYSTYILPFRPYSPNSHSNVEIKKSSYKKLGSLIKEVNKKNWLNAKEVKGDWLILNVNGSHKDVENIKGYKTVGDGKKADEKEKFRGEKEEGSGSAGVEVRELFKPSSTFNEVREKVEGSVRPPSDLYSLSLLTSILKTYIITQNLSHPKDQRHLKLDNLLTELLLKKGEVLETMSKDEASKRLKESCCRFWELKKGGGEGLIRKGAPPNIKIAIKTVGKRMVTLISNFELWDLFTAEELAEELKHAAASSCAVQPISGTSPKKPLYEIMVQGSHESLVLKALIGRGVPKIYIEVDTSKAKR